MPISTVTGPTEPAALGRTLMHEHLLVGFPGWDSDPAETGPSEEERFSICVDRIEEIKALGIDSLIDPCPNDLGRDVELMARVSQKTGFQIICATGLYKESEGGAAYWQFRGRLEDSVQAMSELFIREITEGVGSTGIRAGIIKVGTGKGRMSDYERMVFEAAARASLETGAPITTHTDEGTVGDEQQRVLTELGVPAHRIVIGHSCGTGDHDYHMAIARGGSYLGFDRFGLDVLIPDTTRVASLLALLRAGAGDRVVVSHDSVWCWKGQPFPPAVQQAMEKVWNPTHFSRVITPMLKDGGATDEQIDGLMIGNPRRYFAGGELPELG